MYWSRYRPLISQGQQCNTIVPIKWDHCCLYRYNSMFVYIRKSIICIYKKHCNARLCLLAIFCSNCKQVSRSISHNIFGLRNRTGDPSIFGPIHQPHNYWTTSHLYGMVYAIQMTPLNMLIIIIIMNFYSPVSNTRCHSIGHKMRIARIKIRVDSPGRWERA